MSTSGYLHDLPPPESSKQSCIVKEQAVPCKTVGEVFTNNTAQVMFKTPKTSITQNHVHVAILQARIEYMCALCAMLSFMTDDGFCNTLVVRPPHKRPRLEVVIICIRDICICIHYLTD